MKITLKLFAVLGQYLPAGRAGNQVEMVVEAGTTPAAMMALCHMPPGAAHLVLVNGFFLPPSQWATRVLEEGDALAIWPPVAGG